jgi:cyclopropane-fatty-acyl-phospholipid synthase
MSTLALRGRVGPSAPDRPRTNPTVVDCYSVFDDFFPALGFTDLTDGMYEGDAARPYETAQARQAEVLLDRAGVSSGIRLLDVGCGYGRILKAASQRGADAVGITVSPPQVRRGRAAGLDVRLLDYKHLGPEWEGKFDAVIANGSLEHFAQPEDAAAGRDDAVYRTMFAIVRRVLDPARRGAKFVTTALHFRRRPDPRDLVRPPSDFAQGSSEFHWSRLAHAMGGWYPVRGQLERCAAGLFLLTNEEDGTEDYRLTSETWLAGVRSRLRSAAAFRVWLTALPGVLRRPAHTVRALRCMLGSESWNWQFRGPVPPALLLRQTWERL